PSLLQNSPPLHTLSKGSANIGNGVITSTQIAFIVYLYLHDNRFSKSRSLFPSEASYLLSSSPVRDALKSYLTLGDIRIPKGAESGVGKGERDAECDEYLQLQLDLSSSSSGDCSGFSTEEPQHLNRLHTGQEYTKC
ncbi:unnamed protein product, partial [Brassica oleracea]